LTDSRADREREQAGGQKSCSAHLCAPSAFDRRLQKVPPAGRLVASRFSEAAGQ
jgi:hypothetical protein